MATPTVTTLHALATTLRKNAEEARAEAMAFHYGTFSRGHLLGQALAYEDASASLERLTATSVVREQLAASLRALAGGEG
jgi:hypothetical protein